MKIEACPFPPEGSKITIAGVRFGKQYKDGVTLNCRPGNETVLVVGKRLQVNPLRPAICGLPNAPKAPMIHGPKRRKRW